MPLPNAFWNLSAEALYTTPEETSPVNLYTEYMCCFGRPQNAACRSYQGLTSCSQTSWRTSRATVSADTFATSSKVAEAAGIFLQTYILHICMHCSLVCFAFAIAGIALARQAPKHSRSRCLRTMSDRIVVRGVRFLCWKHTEASQVSRHCTDPA